jgi:hypothetical protein
MLRAGFARADCTACKPQRGDVSALLHAPAIPLQARSGAIRRFCAGHRCKPRNSEQRLQWEAGGRQPLWRLESARWHAGCILRASASQGEIINVGCALRHRWGCMAGSACRCLRTRGHCRTGWFGLHHRQPERQSREVVAQSGHGRRRNAGVATCRKWSPQATTWAVIRRHQRRIPNGTPGPSPAGRGPSSTKDRHAFPADRRLLRGSAVAPA